MYRHSRNSKKTVLFTYRLSDSDRAKSCSKHRQHVADGIGLALDPEAVTQPSVAEQIARFAFVGIGDDIVVF